MIRPQSFQARGLFPGRVLGSEVLESLSEGATRALLKKTESKCLSEKSLKKDNHPLQAEIGGRAGKKKEGKKRAAPARGPSSPALGRAA